MVGAIDISYPSYNFMWLLDWSFNEFFSHTHKFMLQSQYIVNTTGLCLLPLPPPQRLLSRKNTTSDIGPTAEEPDTTSPHHDFDDIEPQDVSEDRGTTTASTSGDGTGQMMCQYVALLQHRLKPMPMNDAHKSTMYLSEQQSSQCDPPDPGDL